MKAQIEKLIAEYETKRARSAEKQEEMQEEIRTCTANGCFADYEQKVRYSEAQKQNVYSQVKADLDSLLDHIEKSCPLYVDYQESCEALKTRNKKLSS